MKRERSTSLFDENYNVLEDTNIVVTIDEIASRIRLLNSQIQVLEEEKSILFPVLEKLRHDERTAYIRQHILSRGHEEKIANPDHRREASGKNIFMCDYVLPPEVLEVIIDKLPTMMDIVHLLLVTKDMKSYVIKTLNLNEFIFRRLESTDHTNLCNDMKELITKLQDNADIIMLKRDCVIHLLLVVHMIFLLEDKLVPLPYSSYSQQDKGSLVLIPSFIPTFGQLFRYDRKKRRIYSIALDDELSKERLYFLSSTVCSSNQKLENVNKLINENLEFYELQTKAYDTWKKTTPDDIKQYVFTNISKHEIHLLGLHKPKSSDAARNVIYYEDKYGTLGSAENAYFGNTINDVFLIGRYESKSQFVTFDPTKETRYDEFYFWRLASYHSTMMKMIITTSTKEMKFKDIRYNIDCLVKNE